MCILMMFCWQLPMWKGNSRQRPENQVDYAEFKSEDSFKNSYKV